MVAAAETIVAIATPPGRGGIGVVRVAGPRARIIAESILKQLPAPRFAIYAVFHDAHGLTIDRGLGLFFPAPNSYTGDDVLELHGHGGPAVLDALVARTLELGARLAKPGEFTERAFLNGKLDLAQAEAVADLIDAGSAAAARAAMRSLDGEFSRRVGERVEELTRLRMYIEAVIDFPEEKIDLLAQERVLKELQLIETELAALQKNAHQGRVLQDGMTVVLAGPPNVGKSSLLNALAQQDTAIVSATPGTTRDVLRERIHIDGMPLHIIDTAGLRESRDEIETEGMRRARTQMERADRILLIADDAVSDDAALKEAEHHLPSDIPRTFIRNKIDLSRRNAGVIETTAGTEISLSAKTGVGLEALRTHLKHCMGYQSSDTGIFSARRRHLDAIVRAQRHVEQGRAVFTQRQAGELLAEELRQAQQALGEITGQFTSDDLLGRIFSSFCIGK